jgi:hypothetical protein
MRLVGDRRSSVRLEVVGALWGTLEVHKQARVRDMNQDGALLEYPVPVVPDTLHVVTFAHEGQHISVEIRVRHVQTSRAADGTTVYLAGVEFVSMPTLLPKLVTDVS